MVSDGELRERAAQVASRLCALGQHLVTAESCTGGWIAKVCTDAPGSSAWFECGFVTYANSAKMRDLGVSPRTLATHGAVSEPTAIEMAQGALRATGVHWAIAVTGIAGPDGGCADKPVGTAWFALGRRRESGAIHVQTQRRLFGGDREAIRRACVSDALQLLLRVSEHDDEPDAAAARA